ncbi:MAG: hypothetical protein H8E44_45880 [Planctomycetes bacterium]|nr:hypothetical protein [Planctomycetota bacterium]
MKVLRFILVGAVSIGLAVIAGIVAAAAAESETAWRPGQPEACLKNGDELRTWFKKRAKNLGRDDKL